MWYETVIKPASGGFGEWDCGEYNGEGWAMDSDLVGAMAHGCDEMVELGVDPLPEWAEDIRGRIHIEPVHVFAVLTDGEVSYHGIDEREVDED
jgi:hypothetical protein